MDMILVYKQILINLLITSYNQVVKSVNKLDSDISLCKIETINL